MTLYLHFYDNLYFKKDIQKTTFGCFKIQMAQAGIVSPGDFEASRFNCMFKFLTDRIDRKTGYIVLYPKSTKAMLESELAS